MKIETANININAKTSFNIEQESTNSFKSVLIESKKDIKNEIHRQNMVKIETTKLEKILLSSEKELSHQDRINKKILEILISNFTKDKDFKLEPKNETSSNNIRQLQIEERTFTYKKQYNQESNINFKTQAFVKTNKGQINIDLDISFSQKFAESFEETFVSKKVNYLDPLIINYNSNLSSFDNISNKLSFEFDLNSDGENELIPQLKEGSGFLAIDKDNNGTIDNGNELFGANTGDGFEELKVYDEDGNSWIDENDSIFNSLLIWEKNENKEGSLIALGQAGVGAIYLAAADSNFVYSKGVNQEYALLKQSSFYLKENGEAGLVTSSDFVV
ncbi:MAG: hypothetical protein ACNI25_02325 [Halarcobacter sp.]